MSRERVKEFDFNFAKRLYDEGKSWHEIGRILGIHAFSVQYWFNKNGILSKRHIGRFRKWDVKEGLELRNKGLTFREIAQKFEVSITAVYTGIKQYEKSISNENNACEG